jgi:hypothetical protein
MTPRTDKAANSVVEQSAQEPRVHPQVYRPGYEQEYPSTMAPPTDDGGSLAVELNASHYPQTYPGDPRQDQGITILPHDGGQYYAHPNETRPHDPYLLQDQHQEHCGVYNSYTHWSQPHDPYLPQNQQQEHYEANPHMHWSQPHPSHRHLVVESESLLTASHQGMTTYMNPGHYSGLSPDTHFTNDWGITDPLAMPAAGVFIPFSDGDGKGKYRAQ